MGKIGGNRGKSSVLFEKFTHTLDREGRLALPSRLREALGDALSRGLCLTCGAEPCLVAYTQERFGVLLARLDDDPAISKSVARAFKRALGERTAVVLPDKQGRILIPEPLRAAAELKKDVTVVGAVDAIELWDTATYERGAASRQAAYERVASRIF